MTASTSLAARMGAARSSPPAPAERPVPPLRPFVSPQFRRVAASDLQPAIAAQDKLGSLLERVHGELARKPDVDVQHLNEKGRAELALREQQRRRDVAQRALDQLRKDISPGVQQINSDATQARLQFQNGIEIGLRDLSPAEVARGQLLAQQVLTADQETQREFAARVRSGDRSSVIAGVLLPDLGEHADVASEARVEFGRGRLVALKGEGARFEVDRAGHIADLLVEQHDDAVLALGHVATTGELPPSTGEAVNRQRVLEGRRLAPKIAAMAKLGLVDAPPDAAAAAADAHGAVIAAKTGLAPAGGVA